MTIDLADPSADPEVEQYKLCPTCRYATPAWRDRCHHCLNDVASAQILHPDAAQRRLERQAEIEVESAQRKARQKLIRRVVIVSLLVIVLAWVGWQVYRTFIWEPPPVPVPTSTARAMADTPEAWPTTGGDARATRATTANAVLSTTEAWTTALGAEPTTELVADTEQLYTILSDGRVVAVRLEDGAVAWETTLNVTPIAPPTIAGDRLYVAMPGGQLVALDAATGTEVFASITTGSRFLSAPIIDQGAAIAFGVGNLIAFDADSGDLLWQREVNSTWATLSPVIAGDSIAVASGSRSLVYDRITSGETYFYEFKRAHPYAIATADDIIYTASNRFIGAYHIDSRRPWWEGMRAVWFQFEIWKMAPSVPAPPALWTTRLPPEDGYPLALDANRIYLANAAGDIRAYARASGEEAWAISTLPVVTPPIIAAERLLIAHRDRVASYDPATGEFIEERPFDGAAVSDVIVTSAGVFVAQEDGTLTALGDPEAS